MNVKKILALLLALMLVLSMAACGSDEKADDKKDGEQTSTTTPNTNAGTTTTPNAGLPTTPEVELTGQQVIFGNWTATVDFGSHYKSKNGIDVGSIPATLNLSVDESTVDEEGEFEYSFASVITDEALSAAAQRGMSAAAASLDENYTMYNWSEEEWIEELSDYYVLEEETHYGTCSDKTFDGGIGISFTMSEISESQFTATFDDLGIVAVFNRV